MRRQSNDPKHEVTLFVGNCKLIILNQRKQIDYAFRTVQLTQNIIYTYPSQMLQESKIGSSKSNHRGAVVELQKLANHQYEYIITSTMRPKLLLYKRDPDILAYLKQLKAPEIRPKEGEQVNIVAIAVQQAIGKYINGFIFSREKDAIEFYEGLNFGIGFQMYMELLGNTLPCNYKLSNRVGEILNGRCCIDPLDFIDGKSEEDEINFYLQMLKNLKSYSLFNFHTNRFETQLYFRIIDQTSLAYACKFLGVFIERIQKLIFCQCVLTSNMLGQIMLSNPFKFIDKLIALQVLDLSDNSLNDDTFTTLANLLKYSKNLHEINLSKNQISCEKEAILFSFLQSITKFKLNLNLSENVIKSAHIIAKYFVNVDGHIPIDILNLYGNPFKPQQLSMLVKRYMQRREMVPDYRIQIKLGELEFQDPTAFQFLKQQFRQKQPTAMSVPLLLSRHPFRRQGKEIGMTQEEVDESAVIDAVHKQYSAELFSGNFYKRKQLKDELLRLGVDIQDIENEPPEMQALKKQQQLMVINKLQNCYNFNVPSNQVVSYLNQTLKCLRIKGLTGPGVAVLAEIKFRMERLLVQWQKEKNLGKSFREIFYRGKNRYQAIYEQLMNQSDVLAFDLASLADQQDQKLLEFLKNQKVWTDSDLFIAVHHLWHPSYPKQWHKTLLQSCLADPRLANAKVLHESKFNTIKFHEVQRINKSGTMLKKSMVDIAAHYGIETYKFSRSFIQSGQSSSGYAGLLSDCKYEPQQESTIMSLIDTFNNFMQILYHTPNEISEQAILYITTITDYLMDRQNQSENDLKCLLAEQFLLRVMTYYDSTKHQRLKRGNILVFCEFLLRRVSIDDQLIYRLIAYLVKTDSYLQNEINFYFSNSKLPWEGKIDWKVKDPIIRRQLLLNRGKLKISIADISNQKLQFTLQVDELSTVGQLMGEIAQNIDKISEFTNINKAQLPNYWLCGSKDTNESYELKFLPSYQHIGKLLFQDQFQKKFYLRRVVYTPQYHTLTCLKSMKYEDLLCLFVQARQSFRESAFIMLSDDRNQVKVKMTVEAIWIDALIQEEIVLSHLRAQQNGDDWSRYRNEREKIINQGLAKIYLKYLPVNTVLNEEARNAVVTELRAKKNDPVPKVMNQMIRQRIVSFIGTIGVCGYTVSISDSKNSSIFYVNNHQFCFLDRSTKPAQCIKSQFKYILSLELIRQAEPLLKFDVIQGIEQEVLQRHQFSIGGEESWLAQCYALLIGVCKTRLVYPAKLLFTNEDSPNGISDTKIDDDLMPQRELEAFLSINSLFSFHLHRSQRFVIQKAGKKQLPPMQLEYLEVDYHKEERKLQKQKKQEQISNLSREDQVLPKRSQERLESRLKKEQVLQPLESESMRQNHQKQQSKIVLPIPAIPQRSSYSEASVRRPSEKNLQIEQIIQNAGSQVKQNDEIVTARRSSSKNASKRRSRNR